jgi:hypothetical protein
MILRHQFITIGISLFFIALVLNLVRKRKMRETYSILWFVMGICFIIVSVWEQFLEKITVLMGAKFPASVLFFFGLIFVIVLLLHFSVEISSLRKQNNTLNQSIALLNNKIESMMSSKDKA